ncbi:P-loop containing nucleoside triphosphate hydrolase protein [Suillus paluster]|uniref:P-loop containing nucleoside triphosphate hydrolase protein n=1 Tax=Suillus paluster TaxID=48578 RepID=UPI001B87A05D|nr:P-loop containing nucleoside triphosphate hydrolase protein [Suillus paluster]KAG1755137.1 P-loop containing nucleoside triphosphate hydrolase protein [Suillus paluster]
MSPYPVIIITGTPGTGKSTHAQLLKDASPITLKHINVGQLVKDNALHHGFDEQWQSYTVDEDKLLDELEPLASAGGIILDWHTCEIFPERWADLVVVLRCNHTILWERLEKRCLHLIFFRIRGDLTRSAVITLLKRYRKTMKQRLWKLSSKKPVTRILSKLSSNSKANLLKI